MTMCFLHRLKVGNYNEYTVQCTWQDGGGERGLEGPWSLQCTCINGACLYLHVFFSCLSGHLQY